jgi:glutathione S-transferase
MSSLVLYDLALTGDRRLSPFCWRVKFALAHKGLPFEARPVRFLDIPNLCGGGHKTVPILEDAGAVIADSWAIADHLDAAYPDRPRIFGTPAERALCQFVEAWLFADAIHHLRYMYMKDIHDHVVESDRAYFRESREKRLGCTLEEAAKSREARLEPARAGFEALRIKLAMGAPFLSGEHPGYADYIVAGVLLWIASIATLPLLHPDDPLLPWFERVRDLHGGVGRSAPVNAIAG